MVHENDDNNKQTESFTPPRHARELSSVCLCPMVWRRQPIEPDQRAPSRRLGHCIDVRASQVLLLRATSATKWASLPRNLGYPFHSQDRYASWGPCDGDWWRRFFALAMVRTTKHRSFFLVGASSESVSCTRFRAGRRITDDPEMDRRRAHYAAVDGTESGRSPGEVEC